MFEISLHHFLSAAIMLIVGLVLTISGLVGLVKSIKENKKCDIVKGVITYIEVEYKNRGRDIAAFDVRVDYSYKGKDYVNESYPLWYSGMREGQQIDIKVNRETNEIKQTNTLFNAIMLIIGVLFVIGTCSMLFFMQLANSIL